MRNFDVVVIGGGLSGLIAAAAARQSTAKVLLLQKGAGAIAIGCGSIDILGYGHGGNLLSAAAAGLAAVPKEHPYGKLGEAAIAEGLDFFRTLTAQAGYPYSGGLQERQLLATALGTLKPSGLFPRSMDTAALFAAAEVTVLGFHEAKDFYPELVVRGLKKSLGTGKNYRVIRLNAATAAGRDVNSLDIARELDREENRKTLIQELKKAVPAGAVLVMPPVLGTKPDYGVLDELEAETGCRFIETAALPPAVTGLRLQTLLVNHLRQQGVEIIEQAHVTGSNTENGTCRAVFTANFDRVRTYAARSFVLATGGFFGGGITADAAAVTEPIFGLPVLASPREEWGSESLLPAAGQPFAYSGLGVDASLRPVDETGKILLDNVHIAGRNLAGYDDCREKSGNGVAVVSGYHAGKLAGEGKQ